MKRIGIGIAALGLSLSALTFGAKAANAAEPCAPAAPQVVTVQPSGYFYGYGPRDFRARERLRIEHERELARRQWLLQHRYGQARFYYGR
jgi:hypothetical protein